MLSLKIRDCPYLFFEVHTKTLGLDSRDVGPWDFLRLLLLKCSLIIEIHVSLSNRSTFLCSEGVVFRNWSSLFAIRLLFTVCLKLNVVAFLRTGKHILLICSASSFLLKISVYVCGFQLFLGEV